MAAAKLSENGWRIRSAANGGMRSMANRAWHRNGGMACGRNKALWRHNIGKAWHQRRKKAASARRINNGVARHGGISGASRLLAAASWQRSA